MGSICGKAHFLPDNAHSNGQYFSGAMDASYGNINVQTHLISVVVMDIAAFKVSNSIGIDIDTTTLEAKKWSA